MISLDRLLQSVRQRFPKADINTHEPALAEGVWFIDVSIGDAIAVIEWSLARDVVGLSTPSEAYGTGPDETYTTAEEVCLRLDDILLRGEATQPPEEVVLRELRQQCGLSQEDMARLLGVQQPAISKFERRLDVPISALQRWVQALGGALTVLVRLPHKTVELSQFSTPVPSTRLPSATSLPIEPVSGGSSRSAR